MKILLKKEIKKLGNVGDVVDVANGYARNYLLPKKLATVVTKGNIEQINLQVRKNEEKRKEEIKDLQVLAAKIADISYTITVKTNKEGKLFGSVSAADIAKVLSEKGFQIDEKMVILEAPIKKCELHNITVVLHPDVNAQCRVWIVSESEKAVDPQQASSENNSKSDKA
ncbi:MAG: 50S ribosomal protein L9 [Candidatus Scalindua sp.]|jgi:large subunit ribosomal protein L9|nr:50S ribosomal protein L9 [Candidatus Scalindua sp.]